MRDGEAGAGASAYLACAARPEPPADQPGNSLTQRLMGIPGDRHRLSVMTQPPVSLSFARWSVASSVEDPVLVKGIEHGRQARIEHLPADVAQQLGHEDPDDAGEAGVVVGEAGAPGGGVEPVDDLCHVAALVASP